MYQCTSCQHVILKWSGQCSKCNDWNTLVEYHKPKKKSVGYSGESSAVQKLGEIQAKELDRISTGMKEFDHVLGGGLVPGSVILLGGDPGIGKSTLLLQTASLLLSNNSVLYVSGEESSEQLSLRAKRTGLNLKNCHVLIETSVNSVLKQVESLKPNVIVIDSIQTMALDEVDSLPGSVSQVRESAQAWVRYAKSSNAIVFMVGHVTKEGALAGPRVLEHMVDTVLYFESNQRDRFRMIRAIKNRFGPVHELGVFAMTESGLQEVANPSAILLQSEGKNQSGSVVTSIWEGTRPLLIEVQALVTESHGDQPRRLVLGADGQRLSMLLAIMQKHLGLKLHRYDVFINVVGGIKITETGIDLAIMVAIISSLTQQTLEQGVLVFGEVGLSGEVRAVPYGLERIKVAFKQGFNKAWIPSGNGSRSNEQHRIFKSVQGLRYLLNRQSLPEQ